MGPATVRMRCIRRFKLFNHTSRVYIRHRSSLDTRYRGMRKGVNHAVLQRLLLQLPCRIFVARTSYRLRYLRLRRMQRVARNGEYDLSFILIQQPGWVAGYPCSTEIQYFHFQTVTYDERQGCASLTHPMTMSSLITAAGFTQPHFEIASKVRK